MLNIQCNLLEMIDDAAQFYAETLGIAHYPGEVEILWLDNPEIDGYCGDCGNGCYEIGIAPNGLDTLVTLAHEFVHLYQYLTGAMRDLSDGRIVYLDKVYHYDLSDDNHRLTPFEIEANEKQEPLMIAFIKWYHAQGKFK